MDVFDRRRERLRVLLTEISAAELARASGVSASYISRCLKEPLQDGYKTIGEVTARRLEKGARKPEGWLDAGPQGHPPTTPPLLPGAGGGGVNTRASIQLLGEQLKTMSSGRKTAVLALLAEYEKDPQRITKEIEMLLGGANNDPAT